MRGYWVGLSALTLLVLAPAAAQTQSGDAGTFTTTSQGQASAILRRAADALGGADALLAIKAVRVTARNRTTARLQSPTATPPFEEGASEIDLLLDIQNKRLSFRSLTDEQGAIRHSLTIIGAGEPRIYNLHARNVRPFAAAPSFERELAVHSRRTPHLLLRYGLANPTQLRALGQAMFEQRPHDVVALTMADDVQLSLFVDRASGLVSKYETLYTDLLAGTAATETIFSDYEGSGLARHPRTMRVRDAGQATLSGRLTVEVDPAFNEASFSFNAAGYPSVPASRPYPERIERLAEGIYVLHSVSDPQHNALAVEFEDHVVVVDAPDSSEGGERLIRRINDIIPNKPIRFVALTHHHADHIGGLRSFIASDASVITTPGNRGVVEAFARAPHEDRLSRHPAPPRIVTVRDGRHVLSDGKRRMELIDVGPSPHAREMLVAYFPQERILYQSDLFIVPSNEAPAGPPSRSLTSFARALDKLGLDVQRIAGGHGRTATIEEFRQRVSYRHPE